MLDQTGHIVYDRVPSKRIVSLVPSQTELLYDLGLDAEVVGITRYCVHPPAWRENKVRIGGTKKFNFEEIDLLAPDLIIANKEENYKEGIEQLQKKYNVYTSDIVDLPGALHMISDIGRLVGKKEIALEIIRKIQDGFERIASGKRSLKVAYLIWKNPFMVAANQTFIHDMIQRCGMINAFHARDRYPEVTLQELDEINCDYILLSTEPYPFKEADIVLIKEKIRISKVIMVDGEFFSWYGSRLMKATYYFQELISKLAITNENLLNQ